eukprot:SAG31_NODE_201_length_20535_cov_15.315081_8_plen_54_part_00
MLALPGCCDPALQLLRRARVAAALLRRGIYFNLVLNLVLASWRTATSIEFGAF